MNTNKTIQTETIMLNCVKQCLSFVDTYIKDCSYSAATRMLTQNIKTLECIKLRVKKKQEQMKLFPSQQM